MSGVNDGLTQSAAGRVIAAEPEVKVRRPKAAQTARARARMEVRNPVGLGHGGGASAAGLWHVVWSRLMDRLNLQSSVAHGCEVHHRSLLREEAPDLAPVQTPTAHERVARIVRTLENDIIPRLVHAHQPANVLASPRLGADALAQVELQDFVAMILGADHSWDGTIRSLLNRAVSIEAIYLDLLTPAARELGRMWEDDTARVRKVRLGRNEISGC